MTLIFLVGDGNNNFHLYALLYIDLIWVDSRNNFHSCVLKMGEEWEEWLIDKIRNNVKYYLIKIFSIPSMLS